jgi:hyperosmotically inducible protein
VAAGSSHFDPGGLVHIYSSVLGKLPQAGGSFLKQYIVTCAALALLGLGSTAHAQTRDAAPNNSGVNVRDRAPQAMTAGQQSNAKEDLELTRRIRRAVVKDDSLSNAAHNIKIVSDGGTVILRGPVKTDREKQAIGEKASAIAGAKNVHNQLEIEPHQ